MNNTDFDYVITKPDLDDETLAHFLGGAHKYINKYMGKNGKWVYVYQRAKGMANQAAGVANKTLNNLQKQSKSAYSSASKKVSSLISSGNKAASGAKAQARKKINTMLPILSKKANQTKSQLKKTAKGTYKQAKKTVKKVKDKNLYQRTKRKVGEATGKYKKDTHGFSGTRNDSRYKTPYSKSGSLRYRGYNTSDTFDMLDGREIGRQNDATRKSVSKISKNKKKRR